MNTGEMIPVLMKNYNYPPWIRGRQGMIWLAALIPKPKNRKYKYNLQGVLQLLIDELIVLGDRGIRVWNAYLEKYITVRVCLVFAINDTRGFPMLALSRQTPCVSLACSE
jgi:hypothetical protein